MACKYILGAFRLNLNRKTNFSMEIKALALATVHVDYDILQPQLCLKSKQLGGKLYNKDEHALVLIKVSYNEVII